MIPCVGGIPGVKEKMNKQLRPDFIYGTVSPTAILM